VIGMPEVVVNGRAHELGGVSGLLIGWTRGALGLSGAKPGCDERERGVCTVLVDGESVLSCRTPVADVAGRVVTTVEDSPSVRDFTRRKGGNRGL
jgi:aerobic-type carbon monoxide dehydrogenase small subunit (CoxS/CutS family)